MTAPKATLLALSTTLLLASIVSGANECSQNARTEVKILSHDENCHQYVVCVGRIRLVRNCPEGSGWSETKQTCSPSEPERCRKKPKLRFMSVSVTEVEPVISCMPDLAVCPARFDPTELVLRAHEDCSKYYLCISFLPVVLSCPANLQFNKEKCQCDYPENVDCGLTTTTEQPEVTVSTTTEESEVTVSTTTEEPDVTVSTTTEESDVTVSTTTEQSEVTVSTTTDESEVTVSTTTEESDVTVSTTTEESEVTVSTTTEESEVTVSTTTEESDITEETTTTVEVTSTTAEVTSSGSSSSDTTTTTSVEATTSAAVTTSSTAGTTSSSSPSSVSVTFLPETSEATTVPAITTTTQKPPVVVEIMEAVNKVFEVVDALKKIWYDYIWNKN